MQSQVEQRGLHGFEMEPTFVQLGADTIVGSAHWLDAEENRDDRYFVLTIRDGKIADMQACGSLRQAKRFARRSRR